MKFLHVCGGEIALVQRQVISRPDDKGWPANFDTAVPFCKYCLKVVNLNTLKLLEADPTDWVPTR